MSGALSVSAAGAPSVVRQPALHDRRGARDPGPALEGARGRLGPLDDARIAEAFLRAIGKSPGEGLMASVWRQAGMVRVERRAPRTTTSSKILHLHVNRPKR